MATNDIDALDQAHRALEHEIRARREQQRAIDEQIDAIRLAQRPTFPTD